MSEPQTNEKAEKIVVLHGFSPEEAMKIVRIVKAKVEGAEDAAFATTTETNLNWKLSFLIEHVSEEHQQFRELRQKAAQAKKETNN